MRDEPNVWLRCLTASSSDTVSFHNFKSQNFKSSVSNPKSKYVDYLSVLSQISNCQGLGRKNKREILKTDRIPTPQLPVARLLFAIFPCSLLRFLPWGEILKSGVGITFWVPRGHVDSRDHAAAEEVLELLPGAVKAGLLIPSYD